MKKLQTLAFLVDPDRIDDLIRTVGQRFSLVQGTESTDTLTFFDTFDWRLHRRELRLSISRPDAPSRTRRPICRLNGPDAQISTPAKVWVRSVPGLIQDLAPGPLRQTLAPIIDMRRLLPLMRLLQHTRQWNVIDDEQKTVARLRLEVPTVLADEPDGTEHPLKARLHVVPMRGYPSIDRKLRDFLHKKANLVIVDRLVFDEAASSAGLKPRSYSSKITLDLRGYPRAADATRHIMLRLLAAIEVNEDGTRRDVDSEFLHDFRVSVRRTRAALSQIKGVFTEDQTLHFKRELSWLGKLTGPTRDLDVYLLKIPDYRSDLPSETARDLEALEAFLARKQRVEQRKLAHALSSPRYRKLIADWRIFLTPKPSAEGPAAPTDGPNADKPTVDLAAARIWKIHQRILKWGTAIDAHSPAERLHDVRLECKKLRYMMEFFRSLFSRSDIESAIKELKKLQENLGDFNDYEVQQASLAQFADELADQPSTPTATLLAMGRLQARLANGQQAERDAFTARFERFAAEDNQERFRRLFDRG